METLAIIVLEMSSLGRKSTVEGVNLVSTKLDGVVIISIAAT